MTALLDTNVLIRHVTGEPPDQAARATAFLRSAAPRELILLDLVVAEMVYVLSSVYRQPRNAVTHIVRALLDLPAIRSPSGRLLRRTLELFDAGMHFDDAYLLAVAEVEGVPTIVSFDQGIRGTSRVRRVEP